MATSQRHLFLSFTVRLRSRTGHELPFRKGSTWVVGPDRESGAASKRALVEDGAEKAQEFRQKDDRGPRQEAGCTYAHSGTSRSSCRAGILAASSAGCQCNCANSCWAGEWGAEQTTPPLFRLP